jgi:hypothetical protein
MLIWCSRARSRTWRCRKVFQLGKGCATYFEGHAILPDRATIATKTKSVLGGLMGSNRVAGTRKSISLDPPRSDLIEADPVPVGHSSLHARPPRNTKVAIAAFIMTFRARMWYLGLRTLFTRLRHRKRKGTGVTILKPGVALYWHSIDV